MFGLHLGSLNISSSFCGSAPMSLIAPNMILRCDARDSMHGATMRGAMLRCDGIINFDKAMRDANVASKHRSKHRKIAASQS